MRRSAGICVLGFLLLALCVGVGVGAQPKLQAPKVGRGGGVGKKKGDWGQKLPWRSFKAGMAEAREKNQVGMVLIYAPWCDACDRLRQDISSQQDRILAQADGIVMMLVSADEEEPFAEQFRQDGTYIPRLYYVRPDGQVMREVYNLQGDKRYKWFFPSAYHVEMSMRYAKHIHQKTAGSPPPPAPKKEQKKRKKKSSTAKKKKKRKEQRRVPAKDEL